ncbi:hypothetical protein FOA52_002598 [Chlamydomonas sp. UWO 241]|nr:hypothetical protein FOA52_002598 [Chlamydomonas sp. UWO 241]
MASASLHELRSIALASSTPGAPLSNVARFQSEYLPGVSFVAHGLDDGTLVISKAVVSPGAGAAEQLAATHSPFEAHTHEHGPRNGQFVTALLVDQLLTEDSDEAFEAVAWGGGPACLLAAATRRHVYIISLRAFMRNEAGLLTPSLPGHGHGHGHRDGHGHGHGYNHGHQGHGYGHGRSQGHGSSGPTLPLPSTSYHLVYRAGLPQHLLALDWAHAASGLLYTDAERAVVMLSVCVTGLDTLHVARGGHPVVEVAEAWSVRADAPHALAAAGLSPQHPCATAPRSEANQHKVIIWWPPKQGAAAGAAAAPGSAAGSSVGAEVVRHPVRVLSMQWSPALAAPCQPAVTATPAAAAATAAGGAGGSVSGVPPPPADPSPPGPSLALMTVGADFAIRIWVEVVMRDMFPAKGGVDGASGGSMAQFCLTLVIDPPFDGLSPGISPGLRAAWAFPLPHAGGLCSESAPVSPTASRAASVSGTHHHAFATALGHQHHQHQHQYGSAATSHGGGHPGGSSTGASHHDELVLSSLSSKV